ncbi:carbohydrate ABC transporter permease [Paenibacillus nasutitermitis]|uniref:Sugar ABC transporter permease n=1 Tax=Paenibacillus nasutitermitis TaxID=1652958 RepID=A0A916YMK2_9BACL|nr:carbohydrate ABC transporter permease [Paenibacillus nasutitermitis]GGD51651.1 sugar ABC transporter permease [Paenibacillus nasutitermitis]
MPIRESWSRRIFVYANTFLLLLLSAICLFPLVHVLAISFSSSTAAGAGRVTLWPIDFTFQSYQYIMQKPEFIQSFLITLERVAMGFTINLLLTLLCAYPLSKERERFRFRTVYAWYFVFTILFSGGLIPWFIIIRETGLLDSIWALVIPGAVPVFNVILMLNFFRELPKEIEESALIDGAGHWRILSTIYVPLSMPSIATVSLFIIVGHWNAWFDGLLLMSFPERYPLSTYLQLMVINSNPLALSGVSLSEVSEISQRTARAAQIFLGALPILLVYPFLQKYFVKGIVLGSVKS